MILLSEGFLPECVHPNYKMPSTVHRTKSTSASAKAGARSASQRDGANTSDPVPYAFTHTMSAPQQRHEYLDIPMPDQLDARWHHNTIPALNHSRSGSNFQTLRAADDRLSTGPSILMSSMSSMPSLKQTPKKEGGFKATIRRMFGSKRQRTIGDEVRKDYHRSDPGNLTTVGASQHTNPSSSGSSRPRTGMRGAALNSHAINLSSDVRDFDIPTIITSPTLKRRNTLPSLAFTNHEAQSFSERLEALTTGDLDQGTLDDAAALTRDKRRSRSAEDLPEQRVTDTSDAPARQDRDSEIAFWRNSILLNPLPKSKAHQNLSTQTSTENVREMPSLDQIIKPSQDFDFGLDNADQEPVDIEERVSTLEVKMFDFEYAIAKLQGVELPKPILPKKKLKRKNVQEIFSKPSMQSLSTATSGQDQPPVTPKDSPILSSPFQEVFGPDRTSKVSTIRPLIRVDSPPRGSLRLTTEQYDALMSMIQDEKDARQLMELQILDLQREIEVLQTPVYATINYPTPSPESTRRSAAQKKLHRSPPFRFNDQPARETSRFSMTESESDSVDNGYEETFQTPRENKYEFPTPRASLMDVMA